MFVRFIFCPSLNGSLIQIGVLFDPHDKGFKSSTDLQSILLGSNGVMRLKNMLSMSKVLDQLSHHTTVPNSQFKYPWRSTTTTQDVNTDSMEANK